MSLDLVAMENTLRAWVAKSMEEVWAERAGGSELGIQVVWSHPNAPAPAKPYAWLTIAGPIGLDVPATSEEFSADAPRGEEIESTVAEHQEWELIVEIISSETSGAQAARALLAAARGRLRQSTALEALRAAGLAAVDFGDTQDVTALFGTAFESRARMDVRLRTVDSATEKTGYIETVGLSSPFGSWTLPP